MAAGLVALPMSTLAAPLSPPSAGTIFQQNSHSPALPVASRRTLALPALQPQASQSELAFKVRRIVIEGNTLVATPTLRSRVSSLENHTVRLSALQAAAAHITALYRARGYLLAYAYLPPQDIQNGVLRIKVVEPKYDHINLNTSGRYRATQAQRTLGVHPGEPVQQAALARGLLLLNQTPGVRVAGTLVPGSKPATSSLEVALRDTPRVQFSAGIDNNGSDDTGRVRGLLQASLDDPFGYGGAIAANALRSEAGLLQSEGVNLLSPDLSKGLRIGAYASHTRYRLGGRFAVLQETGHADQYGLYADIPLILAPGRIIEMRWDWLRDRFGSSSAVAGGADHSRLALLKLTLAGSWTDRGGGVTSGSMVVVAGRKHLGSIDAWQSDALGPRTAGTFWIGQAQLQRVQPLPRGFQLRASISGQMAARNLDGSQQFYLGGPQAVMSYAVGEAGGDAGVLARLGLFHAVPLPIPGHLTAGVLLQGGELWLNHSTHSGAPPQNRLRLGGGGIGLDYYFNTRVALRLDGVRRVGGDVLPDGERQGGEFWASLQISR